METNFYNASSIINNNIENSGINFYVILSIRNKDKREFNELLNKIEKHSKSATKYNFYDVAQKVDILSKRLALLTKDLKVHLGK